MVITREEPEGSDNKLSGTIKEIAARESRDVAHNVQVLDEIAATPAPIQTVL